MKLLKLMLICFEAFTLVGCADLGSSSSLASESKQINNGIYTGKISSLPGSATFSIKVPQTDEPDAFPSTNLIEHKDEHLSFVAFGSDTYPIVYTATVGAGNLSVSEELNQVQRAVSRQISGQLIEEVSKKNVIVNGHPALYTVYTGFSPAQSKTTKADYETTYNAYYFINYRNYTAILWLAIQGGDSANMINNDNEDQLINGTWPPEVAFVNSFRINPT